MREDGPGFETLAVHAGQDPDEETGAVVPPIHLATTYAEDAVGRNKGYEYSRSGNPTRAGLETTLATLEGAQFGFCFASGMAAEDAVLRSLRSGDHLLIGTDAYGGTWRIVARVLDRYGITYSVVDLTDLSAIDAAWTAATRIVWVESPSNPMLRVVDIEAIGEIAHAHGGRLVVDNTFATPYLQQPILLGADIVVHSATKYLGGHSDVVGGAAITDDEEIADDLRFTQGATGGVPSPFDCYLLQRGVKTLPVRMDRQCANARAVAEFLADHPAVSRVRYPGLPSHEGHDLAKRQMRDFGAMVSFSLRGGEAAALEVATRTGVFTLAESLGAVESLVEHPARMTHQSVAGSPLEVDPSLLRLSIGLETIGDLIDDLGRALG